MFALNAEKNSLFNVVSTFAGCGGSSLGYKLAGGKVLLAVEWDDDAAMTYKHNHPGTPLYHGDIANLSVDEILSWTGLSPGELDVFDGSPPCQGFSMAGKRDIGDSRNQLFREYVRILRGLQPKVFVMENVSGMVKGKMRLLFVEILKELQSCGYQVSARLMDARYFQVSQRRQRLIFIGVRNDLAMKPSHPRPQVKPITFKYACEDLRGNHETDRMLPDGLKKLGKIHPDKWKTNPKLYKHVLQRTGGYISTVWLGWHRISGTILKSEIGTTGIIHPDRERYISLAEAKRITGFPDDYWFSSRAKGIERIGNCVPPPLMKAIAEHIYTNFLKSN